MEDAAFQDAGPAFSVPQRKSPKRFIYLVVAIVIIVLLYIFGSRFLSSKKQTSTIKPTPTVKLKITQTPTPAISGTISPTSGPKVTPTINPVDKASGLDRRKLSVEVQNGSGVEGAASKVSDLLKSLGYNVVSSGNADNFDYNGLTVEVKTGSSDYLDLLKADLENKYSVSSTSTDLSATNSADALVIIGK
jgi:hypothetical protein